MSPLNASDLQRIFERLDKNSDGFVRVEQINCLLHGIGVELVLDDLESLTGKSSLDVKEFTILYQSITNKSMEEKMKEVESDLLNAFKVFDVNEDGFISSDELQNVLKRLELWDEGSGRDCRLMIDAFDTNMDGFLDFEEFKNMMFSTTSP